jgi:hypothetical protein
MSDKFLNYTGLNYYHNRISTVFAKENDLEALESRVDDIVSTGGEPNVIETVKRNGTALTVTNKAVDVTVPTNLTDLTNDGNFVADASYVHTDNNYSTTEKNKLSGIEANAEVNVIETVKKNGTALTVTNKAVNITVPTTAGDVNAYTKTEVDTALNGKVDTETGKGLSTNDYTTAEKNKLSGIDANAEVNVIETVKVNGTALTPSSKAVNVTVPTKLTDLTNDGNFVTDASYVHTDENFTSALLTKLNGIATGATKTTVDSALSGSSTNPVQNKVINTALGNKAPLASPTFTGTPSAPTASAGTNTTQIATTAFVSTAVANAIAGITQISYQVVASLPASGENGVIYLVSHSHGTQDVYDEYIWTGSSFEKLGNTDIDLSGYMLKTDMVAITTSEIDALFA